MILLTGDRNQCQGCKEYFNSIKAFERHRIGEFGVDRRCRTPDEMIERGYSKNKHGFWITQKMSTTYIEKITGEKHENTAPTSEGASTV